MQEPVVDKFMGLSHEAPRRSDEEGKLLTDHYVSDPVDVVKGSHSFVLGCFYVLPLHTQLVFP